MTEDESDHTCSSMEVPRSMFHDREQEALSPGYRDIVYCDGGPGFTTSGEDRKKQAEEGQVSRLEQRVTSLEGSLEGSARL